MYSNRMPLLGAPLGSAQSLGSATNIAKFSTFEKMDLLEIAFQVTTATVSTGNIVVTVYDRTSPGVSSGQVTIGTLTIPTAVAAGTVYYKGLEYSVAPGHSVEFDVTTASAGGGAAGAGYCGFKSSVSSEDERNVSTFVASA
jgi:hypothetical protein